MAPTWSHDAEPVDTHGDELWAGPFIMSLIARKLDQTTTFEWQSHTQSSSKVPHLSELLKLLDFQAQSESTTCEGIKCLAQIMPYMGNV